MANHTSIECTDATWNPVTGCTKVSPGCAHCYAERMAFRLHAMGNRRYPQGFKVTLHPDLLDLPLRWRRPRMIFANSMSDVFHPLVPLSYVQSIFSAMQAAHWHLFHLLTKRAERLAELSAQLPWPENLWMGVTVERQDYAWRAGYLRQVPAALRYLTCEPLLGPLELDLTGIGWVIVGGESGPRARPMELAWARSILEQCREAGVPFFLKQLGGPNDKRGHDRALLDGRLWHEMPPRQPRPLLPAQTIRTAKPSACPRRSAKPHPSQTSLFSPLG